MEAEGHTARQGRPGAATTRVSKPATEPTASPDRYGGRGGPPCLGPGSLHSPVWAGLVPWGGLALLPVGVWLTRSAEAYPLPFSQ